MLVVLPLLTSCASQPPSAPAAASAAPAAPVGAASPSAATGASGVQMGGRLIVALDQPPPSLDPQASPSAVTFEVTSSVFESLLYLRSDHTLVPSLAQSYDVSPDAKAYTFKLRQDVKFSDGTPFNAAAVKFNFDRIIDPNFKAGASRAYLADYDRTELADDFTARVVFKTPNAPFLIYASSGNLGMLSPSATTNHSAEDVAQKPVGSGPFVIQELVTSDHALLARNNAYARRAPWSDHDGPPYVNEIYFKFVPEASSRVTTLESGESLVIHNIPPQNLARLEGDSGYKVQKPPYVGAPRFAALNNALFPTDDVAVRRALLLAANKDAIVNNSYKGIGSVANGPLTSATLQNTSLDGLYPYDPSQARKTLEDAGWQVEFDTIRAKNGKRLEVTINTIDYGGGIDNYIQLLQAQWREVGIDAKIKAQARPPWLQDSYNCATNVIPLFLRDGDWSALFSLFSSSNVGTNFNFSCYRNPDVDKLLTDGRAQTDLEKRREIYQQIEKKVMEDAAALPMVEDLSVWGSRATVNGLIFDGYTYPIFSDVWMAK